VVDHDPAWAARATLFAEEVGDLFARWLISDVLHVGSTAVPGLRAKPIIDLQAVSEDPAAALTAVGDAAAAAGWMFVPRELDQRAWRWLLVCIDAAARSRLAVPGSAALESAAAGGVCRGQGAGGRGPL